MQGKLALVIGVAAGYVLGTRAGRGRYEQIKRRAVATWNNPRVKKQVKHAEGYAKSKVPVLLGLLGTGVRALFRQIVRASRTSSTNSPSTRTTSAG